MFKTGHISFLDSSDPQSKNQTVNEDSSEILTHDDLCQLAARQLRAELMGDNELAEKLTKQLEEARKNVQNAKQSLVEEVVLTKLDSHGLARPLQTSQDMVESYKKKKKGNYFDDGSRHSLKQMEGRNRKEEKCGYCLDQTTNKKNLIVDIGEHVFLSLPIFQTLTEGHCLIVPKSHVPSFLSLEENEWNEVNDFKYQLRKMFRSEDKSVIFLETSMNFNHFPHAIIECIPVPKEDGDMAPFYFKKAIQESEYEWAHNKKLIDLRNKGLRHSVPKNLPYFHVEFDPEVHGGYAHVIEDEKYFPRNFGKEVVGGMLDIDYNYLYKNKRDDPAKKSEAVVKFGKLWEKVKNII